MGQYSIIERNLFSCGYKNKNCVFLIFFCLILSQQWDCLFSVFLSAWLLLSSSSSIMESSELCRLLILIFLILRRRITTPSPTWTRCSSTRSLILLSLLVIWFPVWTFWFLLHFLGYMWDKKPGFYERYWKKITDVFLSHKVYYALVLGNHDSEVLFPFCCFHLLGWSYSQGGHGVGYNEPC